MSIKINKRKNYTVYNDALCKHTKKLKIIQMNRSLIVLIRSNKIVVQPRLDLPTNLQNLTVIRLSDIQTWEGNLKTN